MARRRPAHWLYQLTTDRPGAAQAVILDELREVILSGHAAPGITINVDDVAGRFTVSRIPVREALKTLIGEGLVDHEPRAGYTVAQLTRTELSELYVVREALENAALAAATRAATADADAEVAEAYDALTRAIADGDARGHHRESRRFHFALAAPCGMQRLLGMFESAWNITEPQQPMSHVTGEMTVLLNEDHRLMLDAFRDRDTEALLAASSLHYGRLQQIVSTLPATQHRR